MSGLGLVTNGPALYLSNSELRISQRDVYKEPVPKELPILGVKHKRLFQITVFGGLSLTDQSSQFNQFNAKQLLFLNSILKNVGLSNAIIITQGLLIMYI